MLTVCTRVIFDNKDQIIDKVYWLNYLQNTFNGKVKYSNATVLEPLRVHHVILSEDEDIPDGLNWDGLYIDIVVRHDLQISVVHVKQFPLYGLYVGDKYNADTAETIRSILISLLRKKIPTRVVPHLHVDFNCDTGLSKEIERVLQTSIEEHGTVYALGVENRPFCTYSIGEFAQYSIPTYGDNELCRVTLSYTPSDDRRVKLDKPETGYTGMLSLVHESDVYKIEHVHLSRLNKLMENVRIVNNPIRVVQ